jgi:hypothetical protein
LNLIPSTSSIANIIQPIQQNIQTNQPNIQVTTQQQQNTAPSAGNTTTTTSNPTTTKKKKKKKAPKEKKPRPKAGEIRLKFALDGSMLFVCPECQVAYPEK